MAKKALRPRNHPQQARSVQTREDILEASARLLNRFDESLVSTNHIAKATGISIGTLYKYYPNKDAILCDLIDRFISEDLKCIDLLFARKFRTREAAVNELLNWLIETHRNQHQLRAALYSNLGRLIRNRNAFEARFQIGAKLEASVLGDFLKSTKQMLMTVAAINGMIHMISQLPAEENDWRSLREIARKILD